MAMARHLLVVEDDDEIRQVLSDILMLTGYTVRIAGDGATGLALFAEARPDAILLDMVMPGMSGPAFLAALAAQGSTPPPVILLSAMAHLDRASGGLPVAAVVTKPFDLDELLAVVARVLYTDEREWEAPERGDIPGR